MKRSTEWLYSLGTEEVGKLSLEDRGRLFTGILCLMHEIPFDKEKLPASVATMYAIMAHDKTREEQALQKARENGRMGGNPNLKKKKPQPVPAEPKTPKPTVASVIANLDAGDELKEALRDFVEMRTKMRKPLTEKALCMAIRELRKLAKDEPTQIEIVNQSVMNGWQSFYELKAADPQRSKYGPNGVALAAERSTDLDDIFVGW